MRMQLKPEDAARRGLVFNGRHLPYNPKLVPRSRELRNHMTQAEWKLWTGYLRAFQYRIRSQHPIDHYIVDFYCPSLELVKEIDGEQHYTEEGKAYDSERDSVLSAYGLTVLRVTNREVMEKFPGVCRKIEEIAGLKHR
jgi:very-short-patch-repair endonuclease